MKYYGINAVAQELRVHPSSLRRWEKNGLISPERVLMGKTTLRIYDEHKVRVLRRAKELMDTGMCVSDAFGRARAEIVQDAIKRDEIQREEHYND
jgi:MerR family transcriptional regulator, heat shock protein HspR